MNNVFARLIEALAATLLHALWQGALIGALAALALMLLKNTRPQVRYAVAFVALLCCLALPAITLIGKLSVPIAAISSHSLTPLIGQTHMPLGEATGALRLNLAPWLVAFWVCGSGLMFLRLTLGLALLKQMYLLPPASPEWQARLDRLAVTMRLKPAVLLLSNGLGSPLSVGWWRPIVLLPTGLLMHLSVAQIEALLAHELAHIRRHDYLFNLVQAMVEALLFFHPVVWWLSRQIRLEREHIADALAVEATGAARPLAHALAALSELPDGPQLHFAQAATDGALYTRIERLLQPQPSTRRALLTAIAVSGLVTATLGLYACAQFLGGTAAPTPVQMVGKADRLSYALVRHDAEAIFAWGPDDEIDQVARTLPRRGNDYVLVRRNGVDSLVSDASAVSKLRSLWQQAYTLEAQNEALEQHALKQQTDTQTLIKKIQAQPGNVQAKAQFEQHSRTLDDLNGQAQHIRREAQLAYERVEQQLHLISTLSTVTPRLQPERGLRP